MKRREFLSSLAVLPFATTQTQQNSSHEIKNRELISDCDVLWRCSFTNCTIYYDRMGGFINISKLNNKMIEGDSYVVGDDSTKILRRRQNQSGKPAIIDKHFNNCTIHLNGSVCIDCSFLECDVVIKN